MEAQRFDAITKAVRGMPRRRVLGRLAAGTLGPLLGLSGREARAQSCQRSSQCASGQVCVHKTCTLKCVNGDPFTCAVDGGSGAGCDAARGDCFCGKTPGGGSACVTSSGPCEALAVACRKQRNCPKGQLCTTACCGGDPKFTCQPACPH